MGPMPLEGVSSSAVGASSSAGLSVSSSVSISSGMPAGDGTSGVTATASNSTSSAVMVQSRVDDLLSTFGSEVAGDKFLRMVIAMLVLDALLNKDSEESNSRAAELAGLAVGLDMLGRRPDFALFSDTNIIQIQHQSTLVMTEHAVQTIAQTNQAGDQPAGTRLDASA